MKKALALSKKVGDSHLIGMSNLAATFSQYWLVGNLKLSLEYAKEILHHGTETRDHSLIGWGLVWLADITYWMMMQEEDPNKKREGYRKIIEYAKEAASHLDLLSPYAFLGDTVWVNIESYTSWARDVETKPKEKRTLLEQAIEIGRKAVKRVKKGGNPESTATTLHALSKALFFLSQMETVLIDKKELLIEASKLREEEINIRDRALPNWYWIRGVGHNYQALILAELSLIESDDRKKRNLLEKAVLNMEKCLKLCEEWTRVYPQTMLFVVLGMYYDWYGIILNQLYSLTGETENLYTMIGVYKKAIKTYNKADMRSRLAEIHWKIARVYDKLGKHTESAENFELASENYRLAAVKIPQLKEFYLDYASYMDAWNEVERAKHHHEREEYSRSKEHYQKAANILQSSRAWNHLSPNYLAWSQLEYAEDLSRKEQGLESIQKFRAAAELFSKAKKSLETASERIVSSEEKEKTNELIRASCQRRKYCLSRIILEEARLHDKENDYELSAKKYGAAAEAFERIIKLAEAESDRRELQSTVYLCKAWQKMKMAEERAEPALYAEASELFTKSKEKSLKKRTSLLAAGNSYFCKALEFGAKFKATRNLDLYYKAKQFMESASDCYTAAGFEKEAAWVSATQVLFDAYVYMEKAETEIDPEKKTKLYQMAERCLQASAQFYAESGYPSKKIEVLKHLDRVEKKRKFAISLAEVLKAPLLLSSTANISAPAPTREEALGIENFEHTNIQAHLKVPEAANVGEEFEILLDLVNVAKEPGLLVRIDELFPSAFKISKTLTSLELENGSLNVKGKRVEPQKVESIRVPVQAIKTGTFNLNPKIVYVDDVGNFRTCKVEAATITITPITEFQFKTENAKKVFKYLTKAFVADYMKRKLVLEKSGWRTFMQIIKNAKTPKSSIYGAAGRRGFAIAELERRGLVEARIFPGERGRGGNITKLRIYYEKETIKRYIDQRVMKNKEK